MAPPTRLLVLGGIRILQPVHGYDIRRELMSWRLEDVANIKPGSVYGAIRTLLADGCIAVHDDAPVVTRQGAVGGAPDKTRYVLTGEGEKEFQLLVREAWWTVDNPAEPLIPALCLLPFMDRAELIRALGARIAQLEADLDSTAFFRASIKDGDTGDEGGTPEHVREVLDFLTARRRSELEWTRALQKRLRNGAYAFAGEGDFPQPGPGRGLRRPE